MIITIALALCPGCMVAVSSTQEEEESKKKTSSQQNYHDWQKIISCAQHDFACVELL